MLVVPAGIEPTTYRLGGVSRTELFRQGKVCDRNHDQWTGTRNTYVCVVNTYLN